ncbi:TPA: hypothetical protein N0F65_010894 [Lagenidium giganteum]|uniref:N-acetylglucosaminylphosphatidylinositol deacetylase n=1 Tax=Lagenidium giganteum TaxID=4803 RepID=A0AAV2YGL6_9STRA|nr:TPA: hypothetical protein N0F65_010894 [Lagenidium giganteum]
MLDSLSVVGGLLDAMKYALVCANMLLFAFGVYVFATQRSRQSATMIAGGKRERKRAVLVTAHPDDESMFFMPLLHALQEQDPRVEAHEWELFLLCLSRGNFDGLGDIREQEMLACGQYVGFPKANIHVLEDPRFQDGMQSAWETAHVGATVTEFVTKYKIDAVFTFDDYGVSGHPNHISVHHGVRQAILTLHEQCATTETQPVRGWMLESTNIVRKYIGVLDALLSSTGSSEKVFVFTFRPWWNYHAMALHHSQFVWYRRLFVIFSRYTFINTFTPIVPMPAPVDMPTKKSQ